MATFLTNAKMAPELAARIEASVAGRRGAPGKRRSAPRLKAILRAAAMLAICGLVFAVYDVRRAEHLAFERDRRALLDAVHKESASLTPGDTRAVAHVQGWLPRLAGTYEGDVVSSELRSGGGLAAILARPVMYVRGPLEDFTSPAPAQRATAASLKDALVVCLLDPPAARTEKALLPKVRAAYGTAGAIEQRTANVRRLHEAEIGLPLLLPAWEARVNAATEPHELAALKIELERAPVARAKQALRSEILLVAVDEPGAPGGLTELDGERAHDVRVVLVDLLADRVLLRLRSHVDPAPWSQTARTELASGLDACALAYDVHKRAAEASPR